MAAVSWAPAAEAPAPKPEPLKIAFAYVGPVGDGGWSFAHDNGRKAIEKEFGDKVVTSFVHFVEFINDILVVFSSGVELFLHLIVVNLKCAKLEFQFIDANLC